MPFVFFTISLRLVVTNQIKISGDKIGNKERQTQRDPMIVWRHIYKKKGFWNNGGSFFFLLLQIDNKINTRNHSEYHLEEKKTHFITKCSAYFKNYVQQQQNKFFLSF